MTPETNEATKWYPIDETLYPHYFKRISIQRRLSHHERSRRRYAMSQFIANGWAVVDTACEFDVCESTIRDACREHGVAYPVYTSSPKVRDKLHTGMTRTLRIVKMLSDGCTVADVAETVGVSRTWVWEVRRECFEIGVLNADH